MGWEPFEPGWILRPWGLSKYPFLANYGSVKFACRGGSDLEVDNEAIGKNNGKKHCWKSEEQVVHDTMMNRSFGGCGWGDEGQWQNRE